MFDVSKSLVISFDDAEMRAECVLMYKKRKATIILAKVEEKKSTDADMSQASMTEERSQVHHYFPANPKSVDEGEHNPWGHIDVNQYRHRTTNERCQIEDLPREKSLDEKSEASSAD